MVSVFLFDAPFVKKSRGIDLVGLVLMVLGFGLLQLVLDLGEKKDWFDSGLHRGAAHARRRARSPRSSSASCWPPSRSST